MAESSSPRSIWPRAALLKLDNTAGANNNRLADTALVNLQGGLFQYVANTTGASTETIGTIGTLNSGASTILLNPNGGGSVALTATLGAPVNGATVYVQGTNMTTTTGSNFTNLIAAAWNPTGGQIGAVGTVTAPIRADIVGVDTAVTAVPTFLTKASTSTNLLRPLASAEMDVFASAIGSGANTATNKNILVPSGGVTMNTFTTAVSYINSLTIANTGSFTTTPMWINTATGTVTMYNTLSINSGGILVQGPATGSPVNINLGNGGSSTPSG